MADPDLIRGYAQAIVAIAEAEGEPERVEDELFAFSKAVESNGELRQALTDPALPVERKRAVIDEILGDRASQATRNALGLLVEQGRARELTKVVQQVAELGARHRSHAVAEVRTAVPLDPGRQQQLAAALSNATGKEIELKNVVDPSVLGGVTAQIGDEVIDGTVRTRLEEAKELLRSR
ncbi:MAG: ATP synthase F1 subunit delta [Actinomycetota bacterium]